LSSHLWKAKKAVSILCSIVSQIMDCKVLG
jgi:hypothetical protein